MSCGAAGSCLGDVRMTAVVLRWILGSIDNMYKRPTIDTLESISRDCTPPEMSSVSIIIVYFFGWRSAIYAFNPEPMNNRDSRQSGHFGIVGLEYVYLPRNACTSHTIGLQCKTVKNNNLNVWIHAGNITVSAMFCIYKKKLSGCMRACKTVGIKMYVMLQYRRLHRIVHDAMGHGARPSIGRTRKVPQANCLLEPTDRSNPLQFVVVVFIGRLRLLCNRLSKSRWFERSRVEKNRYSVIVDHNYSRSHATNCGRRTGNAPHLTSFIQPGQCQCRGEMVFIAIVHGHAAFCRSTTTRLRLRIAEKDQRERNFYLDARARVVLRFRWPQRLSVNRTYRKHFSRPFRLTLTLYTHTHSFSAAHVRGGRIYNVFVRLVRSFSSAIVFGFLFCLAIVGLSCTSVITVNGRKIHAEFGASERITNSDLLYQPIQKSTQTPYDICVPMFNWSQKTSKNNRSFVSIIYECALVRVCDRRFLSSAPLLFHIKIRLYFGRHIHTRAITAQTTVGFALFSAGILGQSTN